MAQRKITTLELQITGRTANQFLQQLKSDALKASEAVDKTKAEMQALVKQSGLKTGKALATYAGDDEAIKTLRAKYNDLNLTLKEQKKTLDMYNAALKGTFNDMSALAKAADNLANMSLRQVQQALKQYQQQLQNIGRQGNFERDQKFLMQSAEWVRALTAHMAELKAGSLDTLKTAKEALASMGRDIVKDADLVNVLETRFKSMKSTATGLATWNSNISNITAGILGDPRTQAEKWYEQLRTKIGEQTGKLLAELKGYTAQGLQAPPELSQRWMTLNQIFGQLKQNTPLAQIQELAQVMRSELTSATENGVKQWELFTKRIEKGNYGSNMSTFATSLSAEVKKQMEVIGESGKGYENLKRVYDELQKGTPVDKIKDLTKVLQEQIPVIEQEDKHFQKFQQMLEMAKAGNFPTEKLRELSNVMTEQMGRMRGNEKDMQSYYEALRKVFNSDMGLDNMRKWVSILKEQRTAFEGDAEKLSEYDAVIAQYETLIKQAATATDRNRQILASPGRYGVDEVKAAIQATEQLRDTQARGSKEWKEYNQQIETARNYLQQFQTYAKQSQMTAQFKGGVTSMSDAALADQKKYWTEMVANTERGTRLYERYAERLREVTAEEQKRADVVKQKVAAEAENQRASVMSNVAKASVAEIQNAIKATEQLRDAQVKGSAEWMRYSQQIDAAKAHLKQFDDYAKGQQMMKQYRSGVANLSDNALQEQKKYWQEMVASTERGSAMYKTYVGILQKVTAEEQKRADVVKQKAAAETESQRASVMSNVAKASVAEIQNAIKATEQLRDAQTRGSQQWQTYNQQIIAAQNYLQGFTDRAKRAQMNTQLGAGVQSLSTNALEAQKKYWQDMVNNTTHGTRLYDAYVQKLKQVTDEEQRRANIKANVAAQDAEIRRQDVMNNLMIASVKEIQDAVKATEVLRDAQSRGSAEWDKYNQQIQTANNFLQQFADRAKRTQMNGQLNNNNIQTLSTSALEAQKKYWTDMVNNTTQGTRLYDAYQQKLAQVTAEEERRANVKKAQQAADDEVVRTNIMNNLLNSSVAEIKAAITATEQLRDAQNRGGVEWQTYNNQIETATRFLQQFSEQERMAKANASYGQGVGIVSDGALQEMKKAYTEHLGTLKTTDAMYSVIKQRIAEITVEEQKRADASKQALLAQQNNNAQAVMNNLAGSSRAEIEQAMNVVKGLQSNVQQGSQAWYDYQKQLDAAKAKLEEFDNRAAQLRMTSQLRNISTLSNAALADQERFWKKQIDGAEQGSAALARYEARLAAVQAQQKTNAMSNLGLTANGTSFDVGTTGMLAQLNDQSFPKTIEWLNKLKQEVEAFKIKFATTPEGAQMLNQQLEIANTQLQALGATASSTGQQNLFTLQETKQKMRDILANMAARKHPFVGDSGEIEKMNASLKKFRENLIKNGQSTNKVDRAIRGMKGALDTSKVSMDEFKKILAKPSKCDDIEKLNHVLEVVRARARAAGGATAEQMLQMRALDKQAKELNQTFGYHASTLENAASRLKSYIMIYMGFNAMMMKARQAISGNLELADSISNVQKVSGLTEEQVNKLSDALQRLDSRAKTSELLQIAYQGSKMGVAAQGGAAALQEFTESANKLNSALGEDFGGAEAVGKLTKLTQTMGIAARDCSNLNIALEKTGSAILTLGNNTTANYAYINNFATRLGGISRAANISMPDLLAIGATMDVMGMQAEMSATAITKFISTLSKKPEQLASAIKMSTEDLQEFNAAIGRGDTMTAFMKVFETLNKNKANLQDIANVLKDMVGGGNNTRALQVLTAMANGYQTLAANVAMSNRAFEDGTAILNEYNIMNENAAAYAKRAGNAIAEIFINAGNVGVFKDMMKGLADTFEYLQTHTIAFIGTLMNIGLVMKMTSKESVQIFRAEYDRIKEKMAETGTKGQQEAKKVEKAVTQTAQKAEAESKLANKKMQADSKQTSTSIQADAKKTNLGMKSLWVGIKAGSITAFAGMKAAAVTAFAAIKNASRTIAIFAALEALVWVIQKMKDLYDEHMRIRRAMADAAAEAMLEQGKITVLSNSIDRLTKQKKAYEKQVDALAKKEAEANKQKEKEEKTNEALAKSTKQTREEQERALKAAQDAYQMHAKNSIEKAREANKTTELEEAQKKLKKATAELGDAERTMVSILLKHFDAEDLVAKGIINTTNALIDKKKAQEELNKVIQDSYLQNASNELYGENLKVYVKANIDAVEEVRKRVYAMYETLNDKQKPLVDPEKVIQDISAAYSKAAMNQVNGGKGTVVFDPATWKFFNTVSAANQGKTQSYTTYSSTTGTGYTTTAASPYSSAGDVLLKMATNPYRTNYAEFNQQKRNIEDTTGKLWTMNAKDVGQPDVNAGADLDGNGNGNNNKVDKAPEVAKRVKDAANDADKAVATMLDDLKTILLRMFSATNDLELKTTLQRQIDDIDKQKDALRSKLNDYYMKVTDVNPLEGFMSEEYLQRYAEEVKRTGDEEMRRSLESIRRWREGWDRKDGTRMQSAAENASDARRGLSEGYLMHVPEEFYKWTKTNKKGEESSTPFIDQKELARLLSEILEERGIKADEYLLKAAEKDAEHMKKVMSALLEGNPLMKVQDDFVKTLDQLDLFYSKSQDFSTEATKRRIDILSAYTAQITTMTEEEFVERIRLQREYADLTETEAKVLYDKLLKYRDDYDEAARKQAKQSLKLLTNRVESGEYYAQQLASLRKYQEELVKAKKTGTEAYAAVARAIDVVAQKQNQMVNGKRTTYQQRLKQNVESANTRVKMEESVKNTGVNNGVQLGQARVRAARAEFQQQMEQYQIRQALAQETRMDAMKAFENAQAALEQTQKGTKAYEDAALALGVAYRDLQTAEVKATELIGDSYEKMLEKQTALVEKEAEVMSERINNVKEFQESFKEAISKFALANIEAYEAKAFELAELRAKKELGLVQDTARQRYLIIKKNGEYETRWLNQEEYLRTQQEIDANNKRAEALAEGLKNFAERVNKQMRDVFLRRFQLDEEEKKERERQAMLQRVQNDSLVIQHKREHEFTLMMQSEWEARLQAARAYADFVNNQMYGIAPSKAQGASRSSGSSTSLGSSRSSGSNGSTTNNTTNNTSTTTTTNNTSNVTNVYNNVYNENVLDTGVGDGSVTVYLPKDLQEIMTNLANGNNIEKDDMQKLCKALGTNEAGIRALIPHIKDFSAMMSDPATKTLKEVVITAQPKSKPFQPGSVVAPQENIGVVPEMEWNNLFKRALMEIDLGGTIFEAISNAEDGIFDKEAWKSVGISLGMQMATATSAVLVNKLTEWINNKIYGKNVEAKWGSQATGEQRKAAIRSAKSNMDVQVQQATDKRRQAVADLKLNRDVYGEQSGEYKEAQKNLQQAQVSESVAKEYEHQYLKIMKQYADAANEAQKAMKAASEKEYDAKRKAYEEAAGKTITADDMKRAIDATAETMAKKYGKDFDSEGYKTSAKAEIDNKFAPKTEAPAEKPANAQQTASNTQPVSGMDLVKDRLSVINPEVDVDPVVQAQRDSISAGHSDADKITSAIQGKDVKLNSEETAQAHEDNIISAKTTMLNDMTSVDNTEWNNLSPELQDKDLMTQTITEIGESDEYGQYADMAASDDPEVQAQAEQLKADMMLAVWERYYEQLAQLKQDSLDTAIEQGDTEMQASLEVQKTEIQGKQQTVKESIKNRNEELQNQKKTNSAMIAAAGAKETAMQGLNEATAMGSQALGGMVAQATGSQMLGDLTATVAQAGAKAVIGIATGTAQSATEGWWMPAIVQPILTSILMGLLGMATSKAKSAESTIAQATGAKAGRLTTGMLTYATGRYLDDEELKKGRITSGMMTMADGYQPGQSYNVDGADGKSYNAKYAGSVSDMGTGLVRGTHFGIFSEVKPETVIDGDTTAIIHNKYPFLENAWLQIARTGSLNMQEMLGLDYASIGRTIDTLSRSGAFSGIPRIGGMRMPTFASGNYPYDDSNTRDFDVSMTRDFEGAGAANMQADIDSRNRLAAAIEAMVTQGISANVNSAQASKALARQKRFEARNGISNGLNG